jgi:DNA-binding CsgD family transcriptional regulator
MTSLISTRGRQPAALAIFILIQAIAVVYFVGDAMGDLMSDPAGSHSYFEAFVALALMLGMLFGMVALRRTLDRMREQEQTIAIASGALAEVIAAQFSDWGLTPAERDVGLLALKGLDVAEIAVMRGAAQGTVRAQLTRIYAKAEVTGRAQFAAYFVEDLLGQALTAADPAPRLSSAAASG